MEAVGMNLVDPLAGSRDHLGILQLSSPLNQHRVYHLPARQRQQQRPHQWSNALTDQQDDETDPHNLLGQQQQRRQPHPHPSVSLTNQLDNNGRFRRHSHTGLVSSSVQGYTPSQLLQQQSWPWSCSSLSPGYRSHAGRPRSRSRQSSSNALSYQHQLIRTPRALRSAFRKSRKDQSPLLTSASFGADQAWSHLVGDLEEDDYELSFLRRMSTGSSPHGLSDRSNIGYYYNPARTMGQIVEAIGELSTSDGSDVFNNSDDALVSEPTVEMVSASQVGDHCQNSVDNSRIDINPDDNGNTGEHTAAPAVSERSSLKTTSMHLIDKSPETLDIMDEVLMNETSTATGKKHRIPLLQGEQKFGLGSDSEADGGTPDTDMNMILGIASDMELVMPQFDDEYLEDLKNDPVLRTLSRRSSSVSTLSSACSRSPSTTITNSNQFHHSPRSQHSSLSPAIPPADLSSGQVRAQPAESVPVSPGVLAARQASLLPVASEEQKGTRQVSPNVNRDIDNLRRHQYSLKQSTEMMNADSSPARSLQSSPASPASSTSQNLSSSSSSSTPSKVQHGRQRTTELETRDADYQ
ncbi:hypothetical protein BGZ99_000663 [Dissophora globulifera]|uniref:Uncharacterized protein n=1 Tax=Dissophora globulifera TaxID=979702 RepID=A0A9P6RPL5_9FUNG|nr:hypothetical protein BGZ99_000663 [Dissophora globulifera]